MNALTRSIKYFFILLVFALIALLAFAATFDANNYKPQIIEQVENATGRIFAIDGDINLSVFPWVGLKVENVALGNDKGFQAAQFAAIKQLDIKVNVLPLLKKEVQVNTIRLHGLDVSLEVAKDKSNNWSSLSRADADAEAKQAEKADQAAAEKDGALPLQSLKIEGFEFIEATIRYADRSTDTVATVSELNLTTSAITFDEPVDVRFGARVESNQPVIDTRLELSTQLTFNKELTRFNLRDFVFTVLAKANEFIPQQERVEIRSSIDVSMDEQRVVLKQLQLSALGTTTLADITVSQFLETPLIQGGIEVQPFNARDAAKRVAVELPAMAKSDALQHVTIRTSIEVQGEKLQANDFKLELDESTLSGWLHVINISKQQLRYDLAFDKLNVNDYMPPVVEAAAKPGAATGGNDSAQTPAEAAATGDEKIELPVEMMRQLDIEGDFKIAALTAKEYQITQFLMSTSAQGGVIDIKPLSMQVLQGQVQSAVKVNVQNEVPAYAIDLEVNQVQAGPVADPFLEGAMGDKPLRMEGAVNLAMAVKTSGETVNQLKQASKGQIVLDMKETAVHGFDPEYYMRSSIANYVDSKGFGMSKAIMGDYRPRDVTVFDMIHSTIKLADGKARTDDFLMSAERVRVTAKGYVDIMQDTLDVTSSVALPRGKTVAEKLLDEPVFVRVHGPFDALEYDLDTDHLKKSTTDVLEKQAKAKLDAEKQRLKARADEEKRRAEERAKEALKKQTDKYEDKLKDKLKGLF